MGILDFFGRNKGGAIKKHAARAANKKTQAQDRWQSLRFLGDHAGEAGNPEEERLEAINGLLGRFGFRMDPSITDQDEKDLAMAGIVAGGETAIAPVKDYMRKNERIAWPLKMLQQLLPKEEVCSYLIELLSEMETEYERDPSKKNDIIAQLEIIDDERVAPAVVRFVEDVNEGIRFHAVCTVLAQGNAEGHKAQLAALLPEEESVRVRVKVLEAFAAKDWELGEIAGELTQLPVGFALDGAKVVARG